MTPSTLTDEFAALLDLEHREAFLRSNQIDIDGRTVSIHCEGIGDDANVLIYTTCPPPLPWQKAAVHQWLLEANCLWVGTAGATFGISPNSGQILLSARLPLALFTAEGARAVMHNIARLADFWMDACARLTEPDDTDQSEQRHLIAC